MAGRLGHVRAVDSNDTRRYLPRRNPSFAGYEQIPQLPSPPTFFLPPSVHNRYVSTQGRLWKISSPNSFQNPFCPGSRPTNLNLRVGHFEEQHRRYDGHMGPFDPTRNTQLWFPGKEWRALILTPAAVTPRDSPEFEFVTNCWKSDPAPAVDTGRIHPSYVDKLIHRNQEVERRLEVLHKEYVNHHFLEPSHRALWSPAIRPLNPTSENLNNLKQIKRFSLAVDWVTEAQRGLKDKRAFVDYVSRLQATPFWMPDANAVSRMADDRYLGVWLNGIEERQARWYLKEGIPCFIAKEITSLERAQLAAPETMIDFAAGSSAASLHWGVNDYDSLALSRGDLSLRDTSSFHDPGWVWSEPPVQKDKFPAKEPPRTQVANWAWSDPQVQKGKSPIKEPPKPQTVDYGPPPAETVIIAKDRVPWIKPPPVKRAAPSRPGAPPHERKKWIKWVENYQPEGSFREVGAKFIPDHHSHSMYDRDKHRHLFFLHPPRAPEGCVSNPDVFGMPCPKGIYKDMNKNRRPQPYWIYKTQEPQSADVGKIAPVPRPEDLPCLNRTPLPPPDDDSDSDDDYYPDMDFLRQSVQNRAMTTDVSSKSATAMPAAQDIGTRSSLSAPTVELNAVISSVESEPAALGATIEPGVGSSESTQIPPPLPAPVLNHPRNEDEVSIGDKDSIHEAMGPQIPPLTFTVDSEIEVEEAPPTDPLEFASSFLMLYGLPASEEFSTIQNLIASIAAHLQLTVRQIFRVCSDRSQNFWFEMESVDQARQMRTYMHHRRENGRELLVAYADYGDYVGALARSSHRWPDSTTIVEDQRPFPTPGPTASSSSRGRDVRERHKSRDVRQRSPSADCYRTGRRPSPLPRRRSPVRSDYLRRRYQRSPSPHYRERAPYRRSRSPEPRLFRPSRDTIPVGSQENRSNFNSVAAPNVDTGATVQIPPLPVLPSGPAFVGLPHNAPLPFGANVAFMWSPSGNTFSPVLLQGNTTIIPFPMPSSEATPSALLPWPVAAALPSTTAPPSFTPTQPTEPLASRISSTRQIPSGSPPPTPVQPTLMSRMTEHLSARLSDAVPSNLATRLSNPAQWTLADRISEDGPMGSSASWNGLTSWGGAVQPATAPLVTPEDLHPTPDSMDEDPVDLEDDREPDYKRTKRGRRSGQKIQGYRKRDEEREERKRRRRRR